MMESDRFGSLTDRINVFKEGDKRTATEFSYSPRFPVEINQSYPSSGHNGSDFYTLYSFIEKILGRPFGKESIDVYTAVDMTITCIQAYRSICQGNIPQEIPNLRIKKNRDGYRNDNFCTDPLVAKQDLAPCAFPIEPSIPDSTYKRVTKQWDKIKKPFLGI